MQLPGPELEIDLSEILQHPTRTDDNELDVFEEEEAPNLLPADRDGLPDAHQYPTTRLMGLDIAIKVDLYNDYALPLHGVANYHDQDRSRRIENRNSLCNIIARFKFL